MGYLQLAKEAIPGLRTGGEGSPQPSAPESPRDRMFRLLDTWFQHPEVDVWPIAEVRALKEAILEYWQADSVQAEAWFAEWLAARRACPASGGP